MSNVDRAYNTMYRCEQWYRGHVVDFDPDIVRVYAEALADAGLLKDDLPAPDREGRWWPTAASIGNVNISPAGEIVLHSGNFRDMQMHLTPAKARDLAGILLAAAEEADK